MATGTQNMTMGESIQKSISEIREQAAFFDGAEAAFKALKEIYDMKAEDRYLLFGGAGLPNLVHEKKPEQVFEILNNKDRILAQRVKVGEVVCGKDKFGNTYNVIVTWVNSDKITFDGIIDSGPNRGRTLSDVTLEKDGLYHDGDYDLQDVYCIQTQKFDWDS